MKHIIYIENILGFAEIRKQLSENCHTPVGLELSKNNFFSTKIEELEEALSFTKEMKYINEYPGGLPAIGFDDFRINLEQIKTPGSFAEITTLQTISFIIEKLLDLQKIFEGQKEHAPLLNKKIHSIEINEKIFIRINEIIDEKGEIKSNASENLASIRKEIEKQRSKVEKTIFHILKNLKEKGIVEEDVNLSIRNGKLVIPIASSKKRAIKGVFIDESATGQTSFIEPIEVFELNNDIQNLEFEERREIIRILIDLTDFIRPNINEIKSYITFLGEIDLINSKSKLAISQNAIMPTISSDYTMIIRQGRHPILEESLKKQGKKIVPLDIEMLPNQRVVLISGPNAGGKSVAMKTVGLLQYMFQCGFLVPVAEGSQFFPFEKILADIGDQQSIENDLSTYSSHLINMKYFIDNCNKNTLILIDEMGSGTEPESGGAIAEAVLEALYNTGTYGIITTHYFNLKTFASKHKDAINAAMLFDNNLLKPLYILKVGKPGSSFAIEIATNIGLPKFIIDNASKNIGKKKIEIEKMIQDLENEKLNLDNRRRQLEVAENFVSELVEKYNTLNKNIIEKRDFILLKAKNEAKNILSEANSLIEKTIRDIKNANAEKESVKKIRKDLEEKISNLDVDKNKTFEQHPLKKQSPEPKKIKQTIIVGDKVKLDNSPQIGTVVSIKNDKAKVQFDLMMINVSKDRLTAVDGDKTGKSKTKINLNIEKREFTHLLDFRGKTTEEAISELEKFLDNALLSGIKQFSILHGKGYGILRQNIRKHLAQYKDILTFGDAMLELGGEGVTEVKIL